MVCQIILNSDIVTQYMKHGLFIKHRFLVSPFTITIVNITAIGKTKLSCEDSKGSVVNIEDACFCIIRQGYHFEVLCFVGK